MYLCPPLPHCVSAGHNWDHPFNVTRHPSDWRVSSLHHDFCHTQHRHHCLCAECSLPHPNDSHNAGVGEVCVPWGTAKSDADEAAYWPGMLLPCHYRRDGSRRWWRKQWGKQKTKEQRGKWIRKCKYWRNNWRCSMSTTGWWNWSRWGLLNWWVHELCGV